ncbi:hypothetical protein CH379_016105 [Leptospira ellisii]|uniref:Uncharacterized protein n=1 Tax=Leptospira ellisii TaxID=2023197 RepID=A0A2N0BQS2_9LEPT|nr:hypothetical protein [Leptospira ellisii]MDV6237156.1 hypothetical protein [Leptospira ellisii]PJZ93701.1 hypothetical protein CH379_06400 [Leptospira ellisii]PKA06318.1 hypothetical protein CH375_00325 [Leptospira ellisii]
MKRTEFIRGSSYWILPIFFFYLLLFVFTDSENTDFANVSVKLKAVQTAKNKLPSRSFEGRDEEISPFWFQDSVESEILSDEIFLIRSETIAESNRFLLRVGSIFKLSHFLIHLPPPIS